MNKNKKLIEAIEKIVERKLNESVSDYTGKIVKVPDSGTVHTIVKELIHAQESLDGAFDPHLDEDIFNYTGIESAFNDLKEVIRILNKYKERSRNER